MYTILNLLPCLRVLDITIAICVANRKVGRRLLGGKTKSSRRRGEKTGLNGGDRTVDKCVDRIDNIVD